MPEVAASLPDSLEQLRRAFEPYQHLDPAGWVGICRHLPAPVGAVAAAVGILLLVRGTGLWFRLAAAPLGALGGLVWTAPVLARASPGAVPLQPSLIAAAALATLGLGWPPGAIALVAGVPAGLALGQLAGPDNWMAAFGGGILLGGGLALVLYDILTPIIASAFGAWLAVLGALAGLRFLPVVATTASKTPLVPVGVAVCLAVAGSVYQLFFRPTAEEVKQRRLDRLDAKKRKAERKALEERWMRRPRYK